MTVGYSMALGSGLQLVQVLSSSFLHEAAIPWAHGASRSTRLADESCWKSV